MRRIIFDRQPSRNQVKKVDHIIKYSKISSNKGPVLELCLSFSNRVIFQISYLSYLVWCRVPNHCNCVFQWVIIEMKAAWSWLHVISDGFDSLDCFLHFGLNVVEIWTGKSKIRGSTSTSVALEGWNGRQYSKPILDERIRKDQLRILLKKNFHNKQLLKSLL